MDKKQDPTICCLQETSALKTYIEGMQKIFHANGNQKTAGITTLISDKTDFKSKL